MPVWWRDLDEQRQALTMLGGSLEVHSGAYVSPGAQLNTSYGSISIGDRTRICEGAHIVGPVKIGSDCLIGNLAMIRGCTTIADGTRIGFATEIKNAIIEKRVTIGPQCFVADSKVQTEAYLGAQVRTSNQRLDKRNVQVVVDGEVIDTGLEKLGCLIGARAALGIQVIVLPGRMIAPDTIFAPRVTVDRNLPPGRYRPAQQLEPF